MCEKSLDEMADDLCNIVISMGTVTLTPGTPLHNFQQSMLKIVKRYREDEENENTTCEHSGIAFNKDGKLLGII